MRAKMFSAIFLFVLLSFAVLFLLNSHEITGAVVLHESVGFVQQQLLVSSYAKAVSVFSIALGIVVLGTLTLGLFYRAKTKRYDELDEHLEKEINYRGLCEQEETMAKE